MVERSESHWEAGQWLPALVAGLSQGKRKPVSTLRKVYFILHCNCTKCQISTLYSVCWWLYRCRMFRSIAGSAICGGTCSWKVPGLGLWLWWKQATCLPHHTNPRDSGSHVSCRGLWDRSGVCMVPQPSPLDKRSRRFLQSSFTASLLSQS